MAPIIQALFVSANDTLLDYLKEDGQSIEPTWFVILADILLLHMDWSSKLSHMHLLIIAFEYLNLCNLQGSTNHTHGVGQWEQMYRHMLEFLCFQLQYPRHCSQPPPSPQRWAYGAYASLVQKFQGTPLSGLCAKRILNNYSTSKVVDLD